MCKAGNSSQSSARIAKLHPQCTPTPESKGVLDRPVLGLRLELQVKVPEEFGENESYLCISQAWDWKVRVSSRSDEKTAKDATGGIYSLLTEAVAWSIGEWAKDILLIRIKSRRLRAVKPTPGDEGVRILEVGF